MNTLRELRLLSSAINTVERQLQSADSVTDQIDALERLRALQYCLNHCINRWLDRRKKYN